MAECLRKTSDEMEGGSCGPECVCDGTCTSADEAIEAIADFIRRAYE